MLQDGRIIAIGDLAKDAPESVVTGYRASPTRGSHPRWDHYAFFADRKKMEFRLYGTSTGERVTEAAAPNKVPAAWMRSHDYEIGKTGFDPGALISSDGVVFVNERLAGELEAWETVNRVKAIVPKLYGKFLKRQSNGWFYAVTDLTDPSSGKVARFRTELPAGANQIDYIHAWGGATFFVSSGLDAETIAGGVNQPVNAVAMGSGDTDPSGILKSARLFVTRRGRLAVESGLYMDLHEEGRLGELSGIARGMHRTLTAQLEELYG
ncbi:MAG: hypothetical protein HY516_01175 [Candidatus Aenigmarchaeota archaeon]|nr:hypothetical protein [Candidatus Aenigmarchaeota archaeon]